MRYQSCIGRYGKIKYIKLLDLSQKLRLDVFIFGDTATSQESIKHVGGIIIQSLYIYI